MKFNRSHDNKPTAVELQELAKSKKVIECAIADGIFTKEERDRVNALIMADKKVTFERCNC
jgi:hypothetical protein